jgi:hypothetical protein
VVTLALPGGAPIEGRGVIPDVELPCHDGVPCRGPSPPLSDEVR